jgi:pimeloyl-ACP methyl ester carboxylesterase
MTTTDANPILEPRTARLSAGEISYREAGAGDPIVFVHGLLVDGRLWDGTATRLAGRFRCIVPDWPMGSHRTAMSPGADLSPTGQAALIGAFLDELGLERATIVGNDSGGAVSQIFTAANPERVERLILTNCDTEENFPPFPFSLMPPLARMPGGMTALGLPFRVGAIGRATYGLLAKRPVDPELVRSWLVPQRDEAIRRDTRKLVTGVDKSLTVDAARKLGSFPRPVLFAWATEDRFFKLSHAEHLAAGIPDARIEPIEDAKTFVALDRPEALAETITAFMAQAPVTA